MKVRSKPRVAAPGDEVVQLVLVDALERDGVDLDPEPGLDRGVDAVHHLGEAAPAGDLRELRGVEGVERDVDPPDAAVGELGREAAELAAVGGQRQLLERAGLEVARHGAEEGHDALADQRLAAGDPELLDTEADEGRAEPVELLERQQLGLGQELHVLGHAVDAAEVAAVGHRDAQVGDRARERVDQAWHVGQVGRSPLVPTLGPVGPPFKAASGSRGSESARSHSRRDAVASIARGTGDRRRRGCTRTGESEALPRAGSSDGARERGGRGGCRRDRRRVIRARLPGGRGIAPAKGQAGARGFVDGQIREVNAGRLRSWVTTATGKIRRRALRESE